MIQDGLPSVRVDGMGLGCNPHLTGWLGFQKTVAPPGDFPDTRPPPRVNA